MTIKTVVIVPTYNEVENVDGLVATILKKAPMVDICFVDDNSQDGTREKIEALQTEQGKKVHLIKRAGKMGLGTAYIAGFNWALKEGYHYIIEMDADFSHDPSELPRMVKLLANWDGVVGSRYVPRGSTENWGLMRKLISRFGSLYSRWILDLKIMDLTGGFNAWRAETLRKIEINDVKSEGYAFQIELKYRAVRSDCQLIEIPITFVDRRAGQSKMSLKIVIEAMFRVWTFRQIRLGAASSSRRTSAQY